MKIFTMTGDILHIGGTITAGLGEDGTHGVITIIITDLATTHNRAGTLDTIEV
jgi:hypothetical protein